jgi:glycine cleavage system T protein (aminomethyltransferase)
MSTANLKRTPLFEEHCGANARLVDFAGWEMPLHYGSQIDEHHHVRRDAGMFDVSHMLVIDVEGAAAREFLQRVLANDVARLTVPGKALYTCLLNEAGGVIDDSIVYILGPQRFRLVVNAATAETDLAWLIALRNRFAHAVEVRPRRGWAMIAIQGPAARARFWQVRETAQAATVGLNAFQGAEFAEQFIARTGYTGEDGFEVMSPADQAVALWRELRALGVAPCGLGARDTLRLEAGMNLYGQDMNESVTPMESGLAWTVDLSSERDFVGRRALLTRPPQKRLVGLLLLDKGVLRSQQPVRTSHGEGLTTSGGFSPTLGRSIALARVPLSVAVGDAVEVQIRDKWRAAEVVKYPFVRMGKSLINIPPS